MEALGRHLAWVKGTSGHTASWGPRQSLIQGRRGVQRGTAEPGCSHHLEAASTHPALCLAQHRFKVAIQQSGCWLHKGAFHHTARQPALLRVP